MKEPDLIKCLIARYNKYNWILFSHVRRYNGYDSSKLRIADALALNLYPSKDCEIHGFEIKCTRGDWLSELKNVDKTNEFKQFCHRWWIVAPRDIIKIEELPKDWGLMIPKGKTLVIKRGASKLEPKPLDQELFTVLLLKLKEKYEEKFDLNAIKREEFQNGYDQGKRVSEIEVAKLRSQISSNNAVMDKFEELTGVHLSNWNVEKYGKAAALLMKREDFKLDQLLTNLDSE